MLNMLFHAHSGLRYLVLLAALAAIVVLATGLSGKRPYAGAPRIVTAVFSGLVDVQIVLGLAMVVTGLFYPSLLGHILPMLLAAAAAHGLSVAARKAVDSKRAHSLALIGVVLALVFIVLGIAAIGRGPFERRDAPGAGAPTEQTP